MLRITAIFLVSASLAFAQSAGPDQLEKEKSIGWRITDDLLQRYGRMEAPEAISYVERLASVIWGDQPDGQFCCMVEIHEGGVDVPVRPTPVPGGHLFVPVEFFRATPSEADFVRGIAHAIAHIRLRDWWPPEEHLVSYSSIPLIFVPLGDDRKNLPLGLRDAFDAREQRAEALVPDMVAGVALGTGEYERMLESLPPPAPRPSLQPTRRPSLVR